MNTQAINRVIENIDNGRKTCKTGKTVQPKAGRADRLRRTNEYTLKKHNQERRKQTKVRHDTHRRYEEPSTEDSVLEEVHFANFLGCGQLIKDGRMGYNTYQQVNLNLCDSFMREEKPSNNSDTDSNDDYAKVWPVEEFVEDFDFDADDDDKDGQSYDGLLDKDAEHFAGKHFLWHFNPVTGTLSATDKNKLELEMPSDDASSDVSLSDNEEEDAMKYIDSMEEMYLNSMVMYMRQQVAIAQKLAAEELYVCDCNRK